MQHILVCSDLSDRSRAAIARAARLATEAGCGLTACSVVDDDLTGAAAERRQEEVRRDLAASLSELSAGRADVAVEIGEPVAAVGAMADRLGADLIVLGTHRHRPLRDLVSLTTMERIVGASRRAVLLATEPVTKGYARVLGGIDGSPACAAALRMARDLAPQAEFRTFHAVEPPSRGVFGGGDAAARSAVAQAEAEARIARWWPEADLPSDMPRPEILTASLEEAFRKMRYDMTPDLVAIGAHGRPGAAPGVLGSFTGAILRWQFCDTLILRAPGEAAA